jgi:hypothetical protein
VNTLKPERIISEYKKILKVFPSAILSNTLNFLLIPNMPLPSQFNMQSTAMLLRLHPYSDYKAPDVYVYRELRVYDRRSKSLDESLTEIEMLDRGWVKLCMLVNWNPSFSLVDFLTMAVKFLEGLNR